MKLHVTKELLFEYFAGRVSALQKELIEEWVKEPAQEELFYKYLHEWENGHPQYTVDVAGSLEKYRQLLQQPQASAISSSPFSTTAVVRASRFPWCSWLVAATVFFLLGVGTWFFQEDIFYRTYRTAYSEKLSLVLPDQSKVTLNANSALRVPRFGFGEGTRRVNLTGEANFAITHTSENRRFVVQTGSGVKVVVLGTEFSLFARPRETKVVLREGKVQVQYQASPRQATQLTLKPGEMATLNRRGKLHLQKTDQPEKYAAWQHNQFIFKNTSLQEISAMLRENYGLEVDIKEPDLASQTLSGSFQAQTADELLQALSQVLGMNVIRHDNRVLLIDNNDPSNHDPSTTPSK